MAPPIPSVNASPNHFCVSQLMRANDVLSYLIIIIFIVLALMALPSTPLSIECLRKSYSERRTGRVRLVSQNLAIALSCLIRGDVCYNIGTI